MSIPALPVRAAIAAGLLLLLATGVRGQALDGPDTFGTQDEAITVLARSDFQPCSTSSAALCASINSLPNGALLTQVAFYVFDNNAAADFNGYLDRLSVPSAEGGPSLSETLLQLSTDGSPGATVVHQFVSQPVLYREDVDGDGAPDVVSYGLRYYENDSVWLYLARLRWQRRVSPAPQSASFNDVPTTDPAFQFIEALAASGITAGCGTNPPLYCPDAALTRRQMAVFLAKALGLHWPWNAQ